MATDGSTFPTDALLGSFRAVLRPLARLAVATGLSYARIDEVLRQVLVEAASAAHPTLPPQRRVSRISTTLGLNRREVTRLTKITPQTQALAPASHATRLFLKWQTDRRFRDASGTLRRLPRQGHGRTFEKLAQEITRDVHPRSLLGELCRLGLARHDEEHDTVELVVEAFVPRDDRGRMLGFLGANVGDHFDAAVSNVLGEGREHFEQAIFADELSTESIRAFRDTIARQWQALRKAVVPALETLIEVDRAVGRAQDQRIRVGLFSWTEPMATGANGPAQASDDEDTDQAKRAQGARMNDRLEESSKEDLKVSAKISTKRGAKGGAKNIGASRRKKDFE